MLHKPNIKAILSLLISLSEWGRFRDFTFVCDKLLVVDITKTLSKYGIYVSHQHDQISKSNLVLINKSNSEVDKPASLIYITDKSFKVPEVISNNTTFFILTNNKFYQILKPSIKVEAHLTLLAEYKNYTWYHTQARSSFADISMKNETISVTTQFNTSNKIIYDIIVQKTPIGLILSLLQQKLHFDFSLIYRRIPPAKVEGIQRAWIEGGDDILGTLILISRKRLEEMAFVITGLQFRYFFIIRQPESKHSFYAFLKTLDYKAWWSVNVIVIALILGFTVTERTKIPFWTNLSNSALIMMGLVCQQACAYPFKTIHRKILAAHALIFSYSLFQAYSSILISSISSERIDLPFKTIEEFSNQSDYDLIISKSTAVYASFETAKEGVMKQIYDKFMKDRPEHDADLSTASDKFCEGSSAFFALSQQSYKFSQTCPIYIIPQGYYPIQFVMACRKDFPFLKNFNTVFWRAIETGLAKHILLPTMTLPKTVLSSYPETKPTLEPVQFNQVLVLIVAHFIFIVISALILFIENMIKNYF